MTECLSVPFRPSTDLKNIIKDEDHLDDDYSLNRSPSDITDEESDTLDVSDKVEHSTPKLDLPPVITIKCGPLTAKMHTKHFVCPGIHQACIELEGSDDLISPKEFTIRANKDKQKDWKGSIRIGKSNLRTLMEMRSFDFYDHANLCSAKCQSRNYITPKEFTGTDKEGSNCSRRRSSTTRVTLPLSAFTPTSSYTTILNSQLEYRYPDATQQTLGNLFKNPTFSRIVQNAFKNNNNFANSTDQVPMTFNNIATKEELADVDVDVTGNSDKISIKDVDRLTSQLSNEPAQFWNEMLRGGLVGPVIEMLMQTLIDARDKLIRGDIQTTAPLLSRVVSSMGMSERVINIVQKRNAIATANAQHRLSTDFSSVEDEGIRKRSIDAVMAAAAAANVFNFGENSSSPQTPSSEEPPSKRPSLSLDHQTAGINAIRAAVEEARAQSAFKAVLAAAKQTPSSSRNTSSSSSRSNSGVPVELAGMTPSEVLMTLAARMNPMFKNGILGGVLPTFPTIKSESSTPDDSAHSSPSQ